MAQPARDTQREKRTRPVECWSGSTLTANLNRSCLSRLILADLEQAALGATGLFRPPRAVPQFAQTAAHHSPGHGMPGIDLHEGRLIRLGTGYGQGVPVPAPSGYRRPGDRNDERQDKPEWDEIQNRTHIEPPYVARPRLRGRRLSGLAAQAQPGKPGYRMRSLLPVRPDAGANLIFEMSLYRSWTWGLCFVHIVSFRPTPIPVYARFRLVNEPIDTRSVLRRQNSIRGATFFGSQATSPPHGLRRRACALARECRLPLGETRQREATRAPSGDVIPGKVVRAVVLPGLWLGWKEC